MAIIELLIVFIIGGVLLGLAMMVLVAIFRSEPLGRRRRQHVEETRLIQELHQSLNRMEERIEALETIILEREPKKERKYD